MNKLEQLLSRRRERLAKRQPNTNKPLEQISKKHDFRVVKVDELGVVFGFGMVCEVDGVPYRDTQGDIIDPAGMLEATADFMKGRRTMLVQHEGDCSGIVLYGFPLTADIAKALEIETRRTGFLVGVMPDDREVIEKFRTGELTGFSIGGSRVEEVVIDA